MATPEPKNPKAFISYSWDDGAHRDWVEQLATRLRKDGVDVTLDRWHARLGEDIPAFMERAVRENDFLISICTKSVFLTDAAASRRASASAYFFWPIRSTASRRASL